MPTQPMGELDAAPKPCRICGDPCVARTKRGAVEHVGCAGWVGSTPGGAQIVETCIEKLGATVIDVIDHADHTAAVTAIATEPRFGRLCVSCGRICHTETLISPELGWITCHEECPMPPKRKYVHPGQYETPLVADTCKACGADVQTGWSGGIPYVVDPLKLGAVSIAAAEADGVPLMLLWETGISGRYIADRLRNSTSDWPTVRMHACYLDRWFGRKRSSREFLDSREVPRGPSSDADGVWDALF